MHLPNGTLLQGGKYKIVRFIASGGFGCTYEAVHSILGKRLAIKEFFPKSYCNRDTQTSHVTIGNTQAPLVSKLKKKFIAEACALSEMSHPGIVKVVDVFEENGTAYYVMDYIDGKSLAQIVAEKGHLSETETLEYIRQVCDALEYVHSQSRLHLDLKPGNIMVDNKGKAILIDFGVSKQYDEENGENTSTLLGSTPGYAPLEQMVKSIKQFYPATDIYALGATLYKCLTGETPLEAALLAQGEELKPLPSGISASTKKAVKAAMSGPRKKRPQTIKEFLAIIDEKPTEEKKPEVKTINKEDERTILDIGVKATQPKTNEVKQSYTNPKSPKASEHKIQINKSEPAPKPEPTPQIKTPSQAQFVPDTPEPYDHEPIKEKSKKKKIYLGVESAVVILIIGFLIFGGTKEEIYVTEKPLNEADGIINGHQYIDLGLPSGLKWAACNIGASKPEDYGCHIAWGEVDTKSKYTEGNSETYGKNEQWLISNGYIGKGSNLTLSHDAANMNWGGSWRMPTKEDMEELIDNTTTEWTTRNGVNGRLVKSKINGKSIFLPAAGWRYGSSSNYVGENGGFWGSAPNEGDSEIVCLLSFDSGRFGTGWGGRNLGFSVRPVSE